MRIKKQKHQQRFCFLIRVPHSVIRNQEILIDALPPAR